MALNNKLDKQLDLIKDFEDSGMAKPEPRLEPEKKPRKARETIADKNIREIYEKIAAAKILGEQREREIKDRRMSSVSIKGIMDDIKKMNEKNN